MKIEETRRTNLAVAIDIAGNREKLAEMAGTSASYITQCLSQNIKKSLGASMARRIENALGFESGWMDTPHSTESDNVNPETQAVTSLNLLIDQLSEEEKDDLSEVVYMMIRKRKIIDKYE